MSHHEVCSECGHDFDQARIDSNARLMDLRDIVRRLSLEWEKDPNSDRFIEQLQRLEELAGVED
jgi:hypothetical protein